MRTYCIANIDCIHPFFDKMDEYAFACKNVFNSALYEYRQNFFYQEPLLTAFDMINYLSNKEKKDNVPAKVKQQTIKQVYESFKSSVGKSKLPRYLNKETGRANIILTNQAILKTRFTNENKIAFNYDDFCFEFNITNLINKLELKFEHIKQVRVIYNSTYNKYKVLLYVEKEKSKKDSLEKEPKLSQVAAIDLGLNNLMALVFQNQRILFDGKPLKKINRRFNKNLAKLQSQRDKAINELKAVGQIAFTTFHQSYGYEEFIEGIKPVLGDISEKNELSYKISDGMFKEFCNKAASDRSNKYVFIIDEINRGNISKIFGELITLIEDSKRAGEDEAMSVTLPYSQEYFSVPENVYILGTMNTADRSIALMDTALRRRFEFIEMMPKEKLLTDIVIDNVNVKKMLETMNRRIEALYDREHTLGHAFFMPLKNEKKATINQLASIFKNKIIPLLQEYFYEDYEKIMLVLGINPQNDDDSKFISVKSNENLFKKSSDIDLNSTYKINKDSFKESKNYIDIYGENSNSGEVDETKGSYS